MGHAMPELLLELFSEEILARMQARAADDLERLVTERLADAGGTPPRCCPESQRPPSVWSIRISVPLPTSANLLTQGPATFEAIFS
jgi:hypothetical protein